MGGLEFAPPPIWAESMTDVRWVQIQCSWQEEGVKRVEASVGLALGTWEEQSSSVSPCCGAEDSPLCLGGSMGKGHREAQRWARGEELPVRPGKDPTTRSRCSAAHQNVLSSVDPGQIVRSLLVVPRCQGLWLLTLASVSRVSPGHAPPRGLLSRGGAAAGAEAPGRLRHHLL